MTNLEEYYNKFNEDKRLNSRHGQVEYTISMKYIHDCLALLSSDDIEPSNIHILDIGAGTGRYSIALANEGFDVTAVELVKHNLGLLKQKSSLVHAYQGNALKLKRFEDNSFDITLLFGPMYHLLSFEEQLKALEEAKRVTKNGGYILVAYVMNEYAVITYAFKEKHVLDNIKEGSLSEDFHTIPVENTLYNFMRLEDINRLNSHANVSREKIIAVDGAANYIRPYLNQLSDEEFSAFINYQLSVCERPDLMGASAHTVDILRV